MCILVPLIPFYGWGWIGADGQLRETPQPFEVQGIPAAAWEGVVATDIHEFSGAQALISQRHVEADGDVNVEIRAADTGRCLAVGYAQVPCGEGG